MELRQLEHILAVAESGSLTGASIRTGLTQQALSKSLARLEEYLGGRLFERTAHGMTLTRLGEAVVENAIDVLSNVARLRAAAAAELGLEQGKLVIGLSPVAATTHIGQRVAIFAENNPGLRIDVEAGIGPTFIDSLHRGRIDFALATQSEVLADNLIVEPIATEPWGVTARIGNPVLEAASSLVDLAGAHWVLGGTMEPLQDAIEQSFAAVGLRRPQPGIITTSPLFAVVTLMQSNHLAIMPRSLSELHKDLIWKDLTHTWTTPIYLLRRKRAQLNRDGQRLLSELKSVAGVAK
jgi:DNA-binding transcriptional LysR family regulator